MNFNRSNQLTASKNELKEITPAPNNAQSTPAFSGRALASRYSQL